MQILTIAEWMPIASLIVSALGIPTLAGLIITDIYHKRKESSEKSKQEKKKELQDSIREVMQTEIKTIKDDINILKNDSDLTKQSIQATLRHSLYEIADKWLAKGYCPLQDKEDFENIYKKYHALGKNGVMDNIYAKVMELPLTKSKSVKRTSHERTS